MLALLRPDPERMRLKGDLKGLIRLADTGKEPDIRREAVLALGRMQSPGALQDLIRLLTDTDTGVRTAAADALEQYGKNGVTLLLGTYETHGEATVRQVHEVLCRIGPETVPLILTAVSRMSPLGEERAAYTLFAIGEPAAPYLIRALGSEEKKIADFSQAILETMGSEALPHLIEALQSHDEEVKARIAALLIVIGESVVTDLLASCGSDSEETRTLKFYIISEIGTPALEPLYQALRDPNPVTSSMALKLFLEFGESAIVPLITGLFDPEPDLRQVSENALLKIGKPVVPDLIREIPLHKERERDQILALLVRIGEPAIPDMVAALYDTSAEIAKAMITVMPRTGAVSVPYLMSVIGVRDDTRPVERVFREMGRIAFPLLEEEVERETGDRAVFAIRMLRDIDPVRAVEPLITALYHHDPPVREAAIAELKELGDMAMPRLINVLSSGNESAASLAREALISAGDDAAPHLVDALSDPMHGDGSEISDIIRMIGRPVMPYLITILSPGKPGYREASAILMDMGTIAISPLLEAIPTAGKDQKTAIMEILSGVYDADTELFITSILSASDIPDDTIWNMLSAHPDDVIPHLSRMMHDGTDDEARMAGELFNRFGDDAIDALIETLGEEEDEDRQLLITTYLIKAGPGAVPALLELLREPDKAIYGVAALGSIGEPAVEPLIALLKDSDPQVARYAGLTLTRIGKPAAAAIMPILDSDEAMVPVLTKILAEMGGAALPELLGEFMELSERGEGGSTRGIALMSMIIEIALSSSDQMQILFSLEEEELSRMLTNMLISRGEIIITPVIDAMLTWKKPVPTMAVSVLQPLRKQALTRIGEKFDSMDEADKQRIPLIHLLGALGDPSSTAIIFSSIHSDEKKIRIAAVKELGKFGREALDPLTEAMEDPDPEVRVAAAESMGNIGLPVLDQLLNALKDEDGRIRAAAIAGIAKIGEPAQFMLVQALEDPDRRVRQDVVRLLDSMNWKPKYTTDRLSYLYAQEDWETLVKIGPPSVDILARGLHDGDGEVREAARDALSRIRSTLPV